ncbi:hypothetical protein NYE25_20720 [Paenibacillus sp. FSL E2-8871]
MIGNTLLYMALTVPLSAALGLVYAVFLIVVAMIFPTMTALSVTASIFI